MKDKIEGILDIDKKTQDIVESTEKEIEGEKESLRILLTEMENKSNENAKKVAQEKFDEIVKAAESEASIRKKENEEVLKEVDKLYDENKEALIEAAFEKFILGRTV